MARFLSGAPTPESTNAIPQVVAVVQEVLPRLGLAYVRDDTGSSWGLTRSTPGVGLERLRPGQRVQVTLLHCADFTMASGYTPLD